MSRRSLAVAAAALIVIAQLIPLDRSNPPDRPSLAAPPEVASLITRACNDCHSYETVWPWYAWVAPVSFLVTHDVEEGRGELNFSRWQKYSGEKRTKKANEAIKQMRKGDMPPWYYTIMHPEARLSTSEKALLMAWLEQQTHARP